MSLVQATSRRAVKPRQKQKRKAVVEDTDPTLAFMLAQQAMNRWQFEAERFAAAVDASRDRETVVHEAQLAMQQIGALAERIEPFSRHRDMAVRFEAQEVLIVLDSLRTRMARVLHLLSFDVPWRDAAQLAAALRARRN